MNKKSKQTIQSLLDEVGIQINGDNPWDIQVHDERLYDRILAGGTLGVGESYMDGWWDCSALDQMLDRVFKGDLDKKILSRKELLWKALIARLFNQQNQKRAYKVGQQHYDVGNKLYEKMLDKRMVYTCGYWRNAANLDEAQEAKLDLVCRKLGLVPGMKVLDLGCGWGSFAKYAAEKYGVEVTGVTVSREQVEMGQRLCEGLPVDIRLQGYRTVEGEFDRVLSIGILEHVGYKNYRTYMETAYKNLTDDGIAFVHTIGNNISTTASNLWTDKYIFPNSMLPSVAQIGKAMEGVFVMEDLHNFGPDYDKTLMAWYQNFCDSWNELKSDYDERFRRMWEFYLLSSAASFRSRNIQLWQIVMTKRGTPQPDCRVT